MKHLTISQASIVTFVTQLASFVAGFGVINSTEVGVIVSAATAIVNAAFLVANSVHHLAASNEKL